jgi:hypothetical protein
MSSRRAQGLRAAEPEAAPVAAAVAAPEDLHAVKF